MTLDASLSIYIVKSPNIYSYNSHYFTSLILAYFIFTFLPIDYNFQFSNFFTNASGEENENAGNGAFPPGNLPFPIF